MADSENSRTLPAFSNRYLLSKVANFLRSKLIDAIVPVSPAGLSAREYDPVLSLWQQWYSAHRESLRLGKTQSRLETKLHSLVGRPRLELRVRGREAPILIRSEDEIDRWLAGDDMALARDIAKAELAARRNCCEAEGERLGLSAARQAEGQALKLDDEFAGRLWNSQAQSTSAVIGKLHALLMKGQPSNDSEEFPWPQIRTVLDDLIGIEAEVSPPRR